MLAREQLQSLIDLLRARGYRVVGPTPRDGAIVYDDVSSLADLPTGLGDEQSPGRYRLRQRGDGALFGYAAGPSSCKTFLLPPRERLWTVERGPEGLRWRAEPADGPPLAVLGARACDIAAVAVQDCVLRDTDPAYRARRDRLLIIAINCTEPAGTCFCVSMGSGPRAAGGFDIALTEIVDDARHLFVAVGGTERGAALLKEVTGRRATDDERREEDGRLERAAGRMGRRLETDGIRELLHGNADHPRWDDVAGRCLSCGNCTLVCPTCFCHSVEEVPDLSGDRSERWRALDSCFTLEFTHLHGASLRASVRSRYRQWLTHKLASWIDQFGTSGCIGCGRCITWCPPGIDLTEEVRAIRGGGRSHGDD